MKANIRIKSPKEKILIEEIEIVLRLIHEVGLELTSREQYHKEQSWLPFRCKLQVSGEFKQIADLTSKVSMRKLGLPVKAPAPES